MCLSTGNNGGYGRGQQSGKCEPNVVVACTQLCNFKYRCSTKFQAYNITNDAPLPFWDFISRVVTGLDYPPPSHHLPAWLVYFIALLLQLVAILLKPLVTFQPTFTPMRVALASTHHYYSCEKAKREFGYKPPVDFDEGLKQALEHYGARNKDQ